MPLLREFTIHQHCARPANPRVIGVFLGLFQDVSACRKDVRFLDPPRPKKVISAFFDTIVPSLPFHTVSPVTAPAYPYSEFELSLTVIHNHRPSKQASAKMFAKSCWPTPRIRALPILGQLTSKTRLNVEDELARKIFWRNANHLPPHSHHSVIPVTLATATQSPGHCHSRHSPCAAFPSAPTSSPKTFGTGRWAEPSQKRKPASWEWLLNSAKRVRDCSAARTITS